MKDLILGGDVVKKRKKQVTVDCGKKGIATFSFFSSADNQLKKFNAENLRKFSIA
jgi:hypothetical protein